MLQVWTVEGQIVEEDADGLIEHDAVLRRVGLGLPRVPLEHLLSIYVIATSVDESRVRICANKVVAGVRCSTLLPNIRPQDPRQFASAQQINQLEGLAVAIPWG